jgi:penicillin-binding protein 1B
VWSQPGTTDWKPQNYDHQFHGQVQLRTALANSYNIATAHLGIALGIERILDQLPLYGIERRQPPFASSLLGAFGLSPVEVTQLYQTFADGGFRTPLRGIRSIVTAQGEPLQSYPLNVEPVAAPAPIYLLTAALQGVVSEGTARSLINWLPAEMNVAGKTGTTDDLRDSWFAGYTGDRVAVVWVGRDDNQPIGLTGSSGALMVWGEMMKNIQPEPLEPVMPEEIEMVNVDPFSGLRYDGDCEAGVLLPFIKGSAPAEMSPCGASSADTSGAKSDAKPGVKQDSGKKNWFQRLFD